MLPLSILLKFCLTLLRLCLDVKSQSVVQSVLTEHWGIVSKQNMHSDFYFILFFSNVGLQFLTSFEKFVCFVFKVKEKEKLVRD